MSEAYEKISDFFSRHGNGIVSIEILPSSLEHMVSDEGGFFEDGDYLAIMKKTLLQAFLVARDIFKSRVDIDKTDTANLERLLTATQTILLFAPEHLTAANFRKRYLLSLKHSPSHMSLIDQELFFTVSILTSPLHRQSKSPTIWSHRFWVLSEHSDWRKKTLSTHNDLMRFWIAQLTEVVFLSGQRHPKNYYAWSYARNLLQLLLLDYDSSQSNDILLQKCELVASAVDPTAAWCLRQPSDTSGWSFLFHLLSHSHGSVAQAVSVTTKVLDLTFSFKWDNEAIWVFLRTVIVSLPTNTKEEFVRQLEVCKDSVTKTLSGPENQTIQGEYNGGQYPHLVQNLPNEGEPLHLEQNLQAAVKAALKWIDKNS